MTDYAPIVCDDYDFLEIACMDQYEIDLQLVSGCTRGNAKQLETRSGEEYLWITKGDGSEEAVRVEQIKQLSIVTRPARFTER
jgi:transcriptional antiterminator Rof (Rho-off)